MQKNNLKLKTNALFCIYFYAFQDINFGINKRKSFVIKISFTISIFMKYNHFFEESIIKLKNRAFVMYINLKLRKLFIFT